MQIGMLRQEVQKYRDSGRPGGRGEGGRGGHSFIHSFGQVFLGFQEVG